MNIMKKFLLLLAFMSALATAQAATVPGPLVDTAWLKANSGKVVILDVRSDVKSFSASPVFSKDKKTGKLNLVKVGGHIAGAHLVDYKKLRADRDVNGVVISYLLPARKDFDAFMQSVGLNTGDSIVIVSKGESNLDMTSATRLYWSLKYFGHDDMTILDGGMVQWLKQGGVVKSDSGKVKKGNWIATAERTEMLASSDDVRQAVKDKSVQLIDTRPVAQYLGTYHKSYVSENGHIPGAKNFPNELLTGPNGDAVFTPASSIQKLSEAMGIDSKAPSITYCNSGHLASGSWFVYSEVLGNKQVKMYDGSMHQWTKEKGATVQMKVE